MSSNMHANCTDISYLVERMIISADLYECVQRQACLRELINWNVIKHM